MSVRNVMLFRNAILPSYPGLLVCVGMETVLSVDITQLFCSKKLRLLFAILTDKLSTRMKVVFSNLFAVRWLP